MDEQAMRPHHRALVIDTCLIATGIAFLIGAFTHPPLVPEQAVSLIAGATVAVLVLTLTSSMWLCGVLFAWTAELNGWIAYAQLSHAAWHAHAVLWLLGPAVVLTGLTLHGYNVYLTDADGAARRAALEAERAKLRYWDELLARCDISDVHAVKVESGRAGRIVTLRLPGTGRVTLQSLQSRMIPLATALKVQPGAVTFSLGRHSGEVILKVDERNMIAVEVPFPLDVAPLDVTEPQDVGILIDGARSTIIMTVSTFVSGVTGSGKTNSLNVLIAKLAQCTNVVIFGIDLKGGRLLAPWIKPWVEGRCPRPVIDWPATTRCEAQLLMQTVDKLITHRGSTLAGGAAKARVSRDLPQFVIICDEMADVTGMLPKHDWEGVSPNDMADLAAKITRKARSEGVAAFWATQKGTVDFTGSSAIKSQCKQRITLSTAQEVDLRSVSDSNAVVTLLAGARYPGACVIESPGRHDAVLTKMYRLDGDDDAHTLDQIAERCGHTIAAPDPGAEEVMGDAYRLRWERSGLYQLLLGDYHDRTGNAPLAAPPGPQPAAPPRPSVAAVADLDVNQMAQELFEQAGLMAGKPDPQGRMWALLAERRQIGLSVIEIMWALEAERLDVHRSTVYRWLAAAEQDGKVRRVSGDGDATRWALTGP